MKRRKITRRVLVLLCLPLLLALTPAVGLADGEPVPMAPRGYVEINGEEAPDGTEITAKVWGPGGWWIYGPCLTVDGYYDFYDCGATIPVPPYGANSLVRFMVWGIEDRDVSMQWQSGTTTVGSEGDPFSITKAHLDVEITEPDDGDTFSTEQVYTVTARITNNGMETATDVDGHIDFSANASAGTPFAEGLTIPVGESVDYSWPVTCTGPGSTDIEVTVSGQTPYSPKDPHSTATVPIPATNLGDDSISVNQDEKIHLAVTNVWTDLPEVNHASTEQVFHVMATVENEIQQVGLDPAMKAVAEDVMATLVATTGSVDIGDPTPASEDFLAGGEVVTFTWEVTCTGWGDVAFEVIPAGEDENTDAQVLPDNVEIGEYDVIQEEKIHLAVTDVWTDLPEVDHASTEQVFHVMATVENEIQDPLLTDVAYKAVAEDVMATLVALTGSVDIGDPVPSSEDFLAGGDVVTFTWTVTCTDWGDVLFEVTPAGEDENTDAQVLPHNIEKGNYTVIQEEKIHLAVTNIWTSLPNEPEASTEQVFTVYASVENEIQDPLLTDPVTYKAVAEDVVATLTATGDVVIEQALSSVEPDLIGGEDVTFSWVVTCTGPTDVLFSVMPAGEDENTDMQVKPLNVEPDDFEVVQEWKAGLTVEIVEPPYGRTFSSDQVFLVEAVITNTGEADAVDVVALLEPLIGDAVLEGDVVTKTVDRIPGYSSAVVTWTLKCIGSEQVHLWVTATGIDENTAMPIHEEVLFSDDTIVNQEWKAHLYAEIIAPEDGATFTEGQIFTVIATVEQLGEAIAEDPELELQIEGDAVVLSDNPHTFNDMELGDFYQRSWTVECTASGPVTLTVMPSAIDENTDADAFVTPASITVMQQTAPHLVADITAPVGDVSTEQPFVVSVDIANTGEADAVDVEVELEIVSGPAEFAGSETAVHTISVIPGEDSVTESWTLNCTDVGEVTITVTPSGKDGNTGLVVMAEGDTIVVMQVKKAHLVATVEAPGWVKLGEEFTVSATIENTGEAAALDVSALLSIDGHAELVLGEIDEKLADPSTVAGSGSVEITWTLVCTDIGPVTLTVEPDGTDENTGAAIPEDNLEAGMLTINQVYQVYLPFVGVDHHTP
jgi:hypothetical protein